MSLLCSDLLTLSIIDNNLCQNSSIHRSEYCRPNSLSFFKEYYYWRLLPLGALCGRTSRTTLALVPVACRGCWMPGAKEVLGCPRKYFLFIPQNFRRHSFISCQISGQFDPWVPPLVLHHTTATTFFSSFFAIYRHFEKLNWPLGCPQGGCREPSHRPHDTV